jgi:hypothetical protein
MPDALSFDLGNALVLALWVLAVLAADALRARRSDRRQSETARRAAADRSADRRRGTDPRADRYRHDPLPRRAL